MNFSSNNSIGEDLTQQTLPLGVKVSLGLLASMICLENCFICFIVLYHKPLRTYTNGFLVSLATSDVFVGGVLLPYYVLHPWHQMNGYLSGFVLINNTINIFMVSLERFIALMFPLRHLSIISLHFKKLISIVWLVPLVLSSLPLLWNTDRTHIAHKIYLGFLLLLVIILPYILIFIGYKFVLKRLRIRRKNINVSSCADVKVNPRSPRVHARHSHDSSAPVKRMLMVLLVLFTTSWLPIFYMSVCDICNRLDLITIEISVSSVYTLSLNSLVNAVIYSLLKNDIKMVVKTYSTRFRERASSFTASSRKTEPPPHVHISHFVEINVQTL